MIPRREKQRNDLYQVALEALALIDKGMTVINAAKQLNKSRQTLYRGFALVEARTPGGAFNRLSAANTGRLVERHPATAAIDRDPLLDGWEPESVDRVTDPDEDELLA